MAQGEWASSHFRDEYISPSGIIGYRGPEPPAHTVWWNHMPAAKIKQLLGDNVWSSYLKFCVIRNPYDKAVSAYYFWKYQNNIPQIANRRESEDFENWLHQHGAQTDTDKFVIDNAICMDYIVRYDSLHDDLQELCRRLNIPWEPDRLPSFKSGIRPKEISLDALYSERSRRIVEATYAFEISQFSYQFPQEH